MTNAANHRPAHERDQLLQQFRTKQNYSDDNDNPTDEEKAVKDVRSPNTLLVEIKEAIQEEVHHIVEEVQVVKASFVEELHRKDDGESVFLEMELTRELSILPSDLETAAAKGVGYHPNKQELQPILPETTTTTRDLTDSAHSHPVPPLHAYATLVIAVVALSSVGPALDLQVGVPPSLKTFWRMTGTWVFLLPFALSSTLKDGLPTLSHTQCCTFVLACICYAIACLGFVIALEYTSVGNAAIFANSQSILLLLGKFLVGTRVLFMEGSGALVAFSGAILCTLDASAKPTSATADGDQEALASSGWGDFMAIVASIGGVGYLVFAKPTRQHFPSVYVFMFFNMLCASLFAGLYTVCTEHITFDRDPYTGLFGFLHLRYDRLPLVLYMVVICNMIGTVGYVRSMQYFDNIVISVATLLEPVVASFMAFSIGVGVLPGVMGWVGNVLVAIGTICVVLPGATKQ